MDPQPPNGPEGGEPFPTFDPSFKTPERQRRPQQPPTRRPAARGPGRAPTSQASPLLVGIAVGLALATASVVAFFLMNGDSFLALLQKRPGNLVDRCLALRSDPAKLAEELYLSTLSRQPTPAEASIVADYLKKRSADPEKAIGRLAWALIASTEFYANH